MGDMPTRIPVLLLLLAGAMGCGASSPTPRVPVTELAGGTRLKARWLAGPDGFAIPLWDGIRPFHDSLLDIVCAFEIAGDGVLRCMPYEANLESPSLQGGSFFYSDADCTVRLSRVRHSSVASPQATFLDTSTCPARRRRWAMGAALPATDTVYALGTGGACVAVSAGTTAYPLGAEVDYAAYVSAAVRDGGTRGGYTEVRLVAEDGALQLLGFKPAGSDLLVTPTLAADASLRLLPANSEAWISGSEFSDATCSSPAAQRWGSCTTAPPYLQSWDGGQVGCEPMARIYGVGAKLGTVYGQESWPTCAPVTVPDRSHFTLGPEVPPATFPEAPALPASGRLVRQSHGVGEVWSLRVGRVLDTSLGVEIAATLASDGLRRWLPLGDFSTAIGKWVEYYADGECAVRLADVDLARCRNTPRYAAMGPTPYAPTVATTIHTLSPFSGQPFQRNGPSGSCQFQTIFGSTLYTLGPEVPPSTFALATAELR